MDRRVVIDLGPPCARTFGPEDAVVVVDVIRAMTMLVTALAMGRRCLPAGSLKHAFALAHGMRRPLLAGELHGVCPDGFDLANSPSEIARRPDVERPMVLLSTSGTRLVDAVKHAGAVYPACLRNQRAVAEHVSKRHARVTVLGAATRGEFREEDQLCCARIAAGLAEAGFAVEDEPGAAPPTGALQTARLIGRWADAPSDAFLKSRSVSYLERTGQLGDLEFILGHVDDLDQVYQLHAGELVRADAVHRVGATPQSMNR